MAKSIEEWLRDDVAPIREKPLRWLSERYFFRDPVRPRYSDGNYFFSPADGIIVYQEVVDPGERIVDIKGVPYSLAEAMRSSTFNQRSLVIGIFMTFYDVHVNRIPYSGTLSYHDLEPIESYNHPMLALEKSIVEEARINYDDLGYLHNNQRMLNRIYSSELAQWYYLLQIADYDVDSVTPFRQRQNSSFMQNERFSQIRYGSQVDLIIPVSDQFDFEFVQKTGVHVEAGQDPVVRVTAR